jgi:hypothetical protein
MRTLIELQQEKKRIDELIEKSKENKTEEYKLGKLMGEIIQLEIMISDIFELLEWIKNSKEFKKEPLISKIQGETIGWENANPNQ